MEAIASSQPYDDTDESLNDDSGTDKLIIDLDSSTEVKAEDVPGAEKEEYSSTEADGDPASQLDEDSSTEANDIPASYLDKYSKTEADDDPASYLDKYSKTEADDDPASELDKGPSMEAGDVTIREADDNECMRQLHHRAPDIQKASCEPVTIPELPKQLAPVPLHSVPVIPGYPYPLPSHGVPLMSNCFYPPHLLLPPMMMPYPAVLPPTFFPHTPCELQGSGWPVDSGINPALTVHTRSANDGRTSPADSLPYSAVSSSSSPSPTRSPNESSPTTPKSSSRTPSGRTCYTPLQVRAMEKIFSENRYPDYDVLETMSADVGIPVKRIKVWFQNKRSRCKSRISDIKNMVTKIPTQSNTFPTSPMTSLPVPALLPSYPHPSLFQPYI